MTDAPYGTLGHLPELPELRAMSEDVRAATLAHCLRLHLDQLLQVPPGHRTGPHQPLRTQGLDLLNALHLARGIHRDLGAELDAQTLMDGTVTELAELLARLLASPASV
ncbi:phosphopantetheine-binding protein [Streptomyces sp. NPDC059443]|uniref:phosphopantetheine-binding protein n=1 Tax=unclassified Streptomyces TaxID=2593676 RepID=UPI0036C21A53